MRGVGKTYCSSVMTEEMLSDGQQVIIIDPLGVWRGLRSSADGQSAGFPILILGGDYGDLGLDVNSGVAVAQVVIDQRLSVILDLSAIRPGEQPTFVADFCETLYFQNRDPVHLMIDEAMPSEVKAAHTKKGDGMNASAVVRYAIAMVAEQGRGVS